MTTQPARSEHLPQLDGLRAVAVLAVMVHHFWREISLGLPLGTLGVQLFFVLSGFLITRILLRARDSVTTGRVAVGEAMRIFYARRFLRIFPIFYLTLAITAIAGVAEVRDSLWWHLTYASNFYFATIGEWHGSVSHLWSLAVEEQFYLVWPFVVLMTPRRWLRPLLWTIALAAPVFRLVGMRAGLPEMSLLMWPVASLDSLGLGGILGLASLAPSRAGERAIVLGGAAVGAPIVGALWAVDVAAYRAPWLDLWRMGVENTAWALCFAAVIGGAARGFHGPVRTVLDHPLMRYLGRISYGLYLFHPFMRGLLGVLCEASGVAYPSTPGSLFVSLTTLTVVVAATSWRVVEQPLNRLKDAIRMPGDDRERQAVRLVAATADRA